jgi:hypothetical protein
MKGNKSLLSEINFQYMVMSTNKLLKHLKDKSKKFAFRLKSSIESSANFN